MAAPRVFHGARALVRINARIVGIFSSFSYGLNYDVQPVFVLGRFSAAELGYTGSEPVRCTATGWRVINDGPHRDAKIPALQDLLFHEYVTIDVVDRQTGQVMAKIRSVRPESYATTLSTRQLTDSTHTFVGILVDDESTTNDEDPVNGGPADLPPGII